MAAGCSLAGPGDLGLAGELGSLVVPGCVCSVAASPVQPVHGGAGRRGVGEQPPDFGDGERDHAGVGGRGLAGVDAGARLSVRRRSRAAVTAQMARAAATSTVWRAIAG
jgi:hypothetical protein